jgi:two-component system KDP operon response regulator KdpE
VAGAELLLVEDDPSMRSAVETFLGAHGYGVRAAPDGEEALRLWELRRPDLVLVDLGLPGIDGLSIVRRVRRDAATPIIVLSVRDRDSDKVTALDLGADDYLTKPFSMGELDARIRAVLRRAVGPVAGADGRITVGPLVFDASSHQVTVHGREVHFTPREYELLRVLLTHAGHLVTRGRLLRAVWGTAYADESHYLHVHLGAVRAKLAAAAPDGELADLIVTEPGVGYRVRERDT